MRLMRGQRYDTGLGHPFIRPTYIVRSKLHMRVVLILSNWHWRLKWHTCGFSFGNDSVDIENRVSPSFIIMNGINNDVIRGFRSSLSHLDETRVFINNESSTWTH
jgi:hypothetical protein